MPSIPRLRGMSGEPAGTDEGSGAPADEAALVRRILAGERRLYTVLVERYQRRLYWGCLRLLGDPDEAEDAVQETFVRAFRHLERYDPSRRFYVWIYTIARNRCLNVLRRRETWGFLRLGSPAGGCDAAPEIAGREDASARAEGGEIAAALEACLEALPGEQRECFELRHGEELGYAEIAAVVGIPVGTVMSRLARAREKMRACLEARGIR